MARWETIARDLDEQILSGQLAPGERLPSEDGLSKIYGVSRMTVRQALASLEAKRLVTRVHGSGTFVPEDPAVHRRGNVLGSFHEELGLSANQITTRVILAEVVTPPTDIASELGLSDTQTVTQFDRVRIVKNRPISFQRAWIPLLIDPGLARADLTDGSLYETLRQRDRVEIESATQDVTAAAATEQLAEILGCPPGSPLIVVGRVSYMGNGTPVVAARSWTLPDYSLTYELRR